MCLTAKPTVEWTASSVQVEAAGTGVEAMAVMSIPREVDRGPFVLEPE
jgi:hypothetical protein